MTSTGRRRKAPAAKTTALNLLGFYIGRVRYNQINLLQKLLRQTKLDKHLGPGTGHILSALYEKDGCVIKELAAKVRLSPSTLTGLLQRMDNSGLIKCRRDPQDGRALLISLTALGHSLKPRYNAMLKRMEAILQADIAEEDIETVKQVLSKVLENIEAGCAEIDRKRKAERQPVLLCE